MNPVYPAGLYKKGFHVYFQPITGTKTDILFRTAEYVATGFFHNSQILHVDHEKLKITFQYRSWMEPGSRKRRYSTLTIDLYEFTRHHYYNNGETNVVCLFAIKP